MPEVTVETSRGTLAGYLATPVRPGPVPGVVVVHDAFGLGDTARGHADHLGAAGYLTLVPDLYSWGSTPRCVVATMRALVAGGGRALEDIEAARAWLGAQPGCTGRIGVIGFCMGGGFALLAAPGGGFAAAAPNYGQVPKDAEAALAGACPVVASFGGRDRSLRGHAARLEQALTALGVPHDVKEYPDAGHSFLDRHNAGPMVPLLRVGGMGYHHPSAEDAWRRILTFFAEHLGDERPPPATG
ncbi:MAG TPA: dienelactone hydrolase family protein [Acidimicrobiales bacterium]|jgi:carboxymethylenebutenolidase|nr:dienelactone hydrolase family protein [Acidimicrobiales bacterium]